MQCSGTALFVTKKVSLYEQCPEDNKTSEEHTKEDFKNEKDQIGILQMLTLSSVNKDHIRCENKDYYPPGFYNKPYLPPR